MAGGCDTEQGDGVLRESTVPWNRREEVRQKQPPSPHPSSSSKPLARNPPGRMEGLGKYMYKGTHNPMAGHVIFQVTQIQRRSTSREDGQRSVQLCVGLGY